MADPLQTLFEAVRAICTTATWSRGVELVRGDRVVGLETDDPIELKCRVSERGGMISPTVTLFTDDADWECQCPSPEEACEHAAAAVIALRRAAEGGHTLKTAEQAGHIEYRFQRGAGGLGLTRVIVRGKDEYLIESTLAALMNRPDAPAFVAGQADLGAELALGTHRRGLLPPGVVPKVFRRLARCPAVSLDGQAVKVQAEPVLPLVIVEDQGDGLRLAAIDAIVVDERFQNGILRCDDVLRPLGEPRLTGREREELARGRYFGPDSVSELVTEILPDLRKRLPVEVRTTRLPSADRVPPWIRLQVSREGDRLSVLPTLVYGDPPTGRVDGGRLVHLDGPVPLRDQPAEKRLVTRLQRQLAMAPGYRETFVGEQAVTLRAKLGPWHGWVRGTGLDWFRRAAPLDVEVQVEGTGFDVLFSSTRGDAGSGDGTTSGSAARADPRAVLRAWRAGESLVPLLGGGWAPLPQDWLDRFGERITDLLEARDERGTVPSSAAREIVALCEDLEQPAPPALAGLSRRLDDFDGIAVAPLPADLTVALRPYQARGVDWLVFLRETGLGGLLADDMGLGKTLQALCALHGRTLVVAPTSVLHNWADEIARHRPGLTSAVYHGPRRALDTTVDVTLTTYAILRLDADLMAAEKWDTVILDEAQAIKNPESQVAEAAFRLQADFRLTLTGTPVENRLEELWSQFHFINRGLLGGRQAFQERYAAAIAVGESGAAERLRQRIRPFVLRRMKQDVAPELPPRTEIVLRCELSEREREVYDTIRAATLSEVVAKLEAGGSVMAALEALLRLRQASCHVALVPGHDATGSSKLSVLLEALDNVVAEGHKALVFSQWTSLLDLTEPHLERNGIPFLRLDGSTRDRGGVVRGFQAEDGPPVLLISLKAGGSGLNLTAADHVFLLDPWWNPAVEDQAADRAHRIGQDRPVLIYRLVAEKTVEERILKLQEAKRAIANAVLGGADRATGLTRNDLLDLLQ